MSVRRLYALVGLALLMALAVTATKLFSPHPETPREADITLPADPECDLQLGPCTLPLTGGGRVTFAIEPRPIRPIEPLRITAQIEGAAVKDVLVDMQGVTMNMGITRFRLEPGDDGRYAGGGQLPICVRSRMDWRADVWLQTEQQGVIVAPFLFSTITPPR